MVAATAAGLKAPRYKDSDFSRCCSAGALYRPATGTWLIRQSSTLTVTTMVFGGGTDIPVPAEYDGDGQADVAVFRPYDGPGGTFYIRQSSTLTVTGTGWGGGTDIPTPKRP